jgi:dimethylhistidine N-methyltransferase
VSRAASARVGASSATRVRFHDYHPTPADLRAEVLAGLSLSPKRLSPKFFYDRRGSQLFDAITELPEYYPTRTEIAILAEHGEEMAGRLGRGQVLVELGSGSSLKIQTLLEALAPAIYVPVDISKEHLLASADALARRFPGLRIEAVCADYSGAFELPLRPDWGTPAAFFPGSSIGNFEPAAAARLLRRVADLLGPGGRLLIGVDLLKDRAVLEAAYNDAQGVTADFNLNLLARINRELEADFNLGAFAHRAWFNPMPDPSRPDGPGRIEMHLVSQRAQRVQVAGREFALAERECIHSENSYKYALPGFTQLAASAGFATEQVWTDPAGLFSVHCLRVAG